MKSQQQPPIAEQPAMFTVSTMGANVTVKRKRSHVEPGLPTEPRKINLKSKRKLEMSKNMRLDQFFTKKPKSQVNNEAEIEKNFEYEFQLNIELKRKIADIDEETRDFQDFAGTMLRKLLQENIQIKQRMGQARKLDFILNEQILKNTEIMIQNQKLYSAKPTSCFDCHYMKLKTKSSLQKIKQSLDLRRGNKMNLKLGTDQSGCRFKIFSPGGVWATVGNIYQPMELIWKAEDFEFYKAISLTTTDYVAIKLYRSSKRLKADNEIKIHSGLKHPNIIKLVDFFEYSKGEVALVFEWADYELTDIYMELSEKNTMEVCLMIAEGLLYLFSLGVVHRKIIASNIMFRNGIVKICDFSCAVYRETTDPEWLRLDSSQRHIAPEGQRICNDKFDVWSLGVILYQCLRKVNANDLDDAQWQTSLANKKPARKEEILLHCMLQTSHYERPAIQEVIQQINKIRHSTQRQAR